MANKWGIPANVEKLVLERDKSCVYCGVVFSENETSRGKKKSWEHIINDIRINDSKNIALCCISCNASKGAKDLKDWLKTKYCKDKGINTDTISKVIREILPKT